MTIDTAYAEAYNDLLQSQGVYAIAQADLNNAQVYNSGGWTMLFESSTMNGNILVICGHSYKFGSVAIYRNEDDLNESMNAIIESHDKTVLTMPEKLDTIQDAIDTLHFIMGAEDDRTNNDLPPTDEFNQAAKNAILKLRQNY